MIGKNSDKEIANFDIILVEIVVLRTESKQNWRLRAAVLIE